MATLNNAAAIETWALANPQKAVALGEFLVEASLDPDDAEIPESFDDAQVAAAEWAEENPTRAKILFLKLLPKLKKYRKSA